MDVTTYEFETCVGALFEMSTAGARRILPAHLQPIEIRHMRSLLAVLAFRFERTAIGAYDEIVLSVITPPRIEPGRPLPKAAFYPFMLATNTETARVHAIERWHLPHFMKDMEFAFDEEDGRMRVTVSDDGSPVIRLTVSDHEFRPAVNPYHCFTVDGDDRFKVNISMDGLHSEHEEESGELELFEHPMTHDLILSDVDSYPLREEWYKMGIQIIEQLERI